MNISDHIRTANLSALKEVLEATPSLVNTPDERGFTPLVLATYLNQASVAELLLDHGAEINAQDAQMGMTALMGVCVKGSAELTKLLLERGADPAIKNKSGETALDFARKGGHTAVVELLS